MQSAFQEKCSYTKAARGLLDEGSVMVRHINCLRRQFKTQSCCHGYYQISLNTEKKLFCQYFFCKSGGSTRLWCSISASVKIAQFISLFVVVIFCRLRYQSLKSNKNNFRLVNTQCKKAPLDSQKHF